MAPSSAERQIRLLRAYQRPKEVSTTTFPELDLMITTLYDDVNDALIFDFHKEDPSFEFPDEDGRVFWNISLITGEVTSITIVGAKKFGISEIRFEIAPRKEAIEIGMKNMPLACGTGRPTRRLVESIAVTMDGRQSKHSTQNLNITNALELALVEFKRDYAIN